MSATRKAPHYVIPRPWQIVAVTFDDGTVVQVTEEALRRYLETGDAAALGVHDGSEQLRTAIANIAKRVAAVDRASKPRRTNVTREQLVAYRERYMANHGGKDHGWQAQASRDFHISTKTIRDRLK